MAEFSNAPFEASLAKISRAQKHIKELEDMAAAYLATEPAKVSYDPTPPDGMKTGFRFNFSIRGVPIEMGAALGDAIHNLRSALDLMASDLCRLNGKSPEDVYFPFCDEEGYLDKMIVKRHFDRAGDAAVKLLRELKPYKGGNSALRALHDLDVQDKHQMLIPSPLSVAGPILELHDGKGNYHRDEQGQPKPKIVGDPNKPSEIKLVLPDTCALAGQELIPTLHKLVETTATIVERFKALVAPSG
jgi:hypothetical protein